MHWGLSNLIKKLICTLLLDFSLVKTVLPLEPINISRYYNNTEEVKPLYEIIEGKVLDEEGNPIEAVNIIVEGSNIGVFTNSEGYFKLFTSPGKYNLIISHINYKKIITSEENKPLEVILERNIHELPEVSIIFEKKQEPVIPPEVIVDVLGGGNTEIRLYNVGMGTKSCINQNLTYTGLLIKPHKNDTPTTSITHLVGLKGAIDTRIDTVTVDLSGDVEHRGGIPAYINIKPKYAEINGAFFSVGIPEIFAMYNRVKSNNTTTLSISGTNYIAMQRVVGPLLNLNNSTVLPYYISGVGFSKINNSLGKLEIYSSLSYEGIKLYNESAPGFTNSFFVGDANNMDLSMRLERKDIESSITISSNNFDFSANATDLIDDTNFINDTSVKSLIVKGTHSYYLKNTKFGLNIEYLKGERAKKEYVSTNWNISDYNESFNNEKQFEQRGIIGLYLKREIPLEVLVLKVGTRVDYISGNQWYSFAGGIPSISGNFNISKDISSFNLNLSIAKVSDFSLGGPPKYGEDSPFIEDSYPEEDIRIVLSAKKQSEREYALTKGLESVLYAHKLHNIEQYGKKYDGYAIGGGLTLESKIKIPLGNKYIPVGNVLTLTLIDTELESVRTNYTEVAKLTLLTGIDLGNWSFYSTLDFGTGRPYTPMYYSEVIQENTPIEIYMWEEGEKNSQTLPFYTILGLTITNTNYLYFNKRPYPITTKLAIGGLGGKVVGYTYNPNGSQKSIQAPIIVGISIDTRL